MRILNYEVHFSIEKRHSFWDLIRSPTGGIVTSDSIYENLVDNIQEPELKPWKLTIEPEKRMRVMHSDILKYAFRDIIAQMLMNPKEAGAIFLGIVAFTETFKNDMILKGTNEESIKEYDVAVDEHVDAALNSIKRSNPELYNDIVDYLEDDNNDS